MVSVFFATAKLAGAAALVGLACACVFGRNGMGAASVGSGRTSGASCDLDGLRTGFGTAFDAGVGYVITAAWVAGIDAACAGHHLSVILTDTGGAVVGHGPSVLIPAGGGSVTIPLKPMVAATVSRLDTLMG
jgi:hypothetical protein